MAFPLWALNLDFCIKPGGTFINTGLGYFDVWTGGEIGVVVNRKHYFALNAHFYNDVQNTKYYYDPVSSKNSWSDEIHHYANVYGGYARRFEIKEYLNISSGIYVGGKYAEYDRNWDTTVVLKYSKDEKATTLIGQVNLRHEAEGRYLAFGGPFIENQIGYKNLFLHFNVVLNIGVLETFGYYSVRDRGVTNILFEDDYFVEDIKIIDIGWKKNTDYTLLKGIKFIPELNIGISIYL